MFRVLLLLVMLLLLARALLRFFGGVMQGATGQAAGAGARRPAAPPPTKMVQDPVCGTYVVPGKAVTASRGGHTQFFCSEACRQKYLTAS